MRVYVGAVVILGIVTGVWSCSSDSGTPDGGTDASPPVEAAADVAKPDSGSDAKVDAPPPPCDYSKPFGSLTAITSVNTAGNEAKPRLSPDELEIYFERDGDIYVAKRTSISTPFATAVKQPISTAEPEGSPTVSGNVMFFMAMRADAGNNWDLWSASRATASDPFASAQWYSYRDGGMYQYNSNNHDVDPYYAPSGSTLYFATEGIGTPKPYDLIEVDVGLVIPNQPFDNVNNPSTEEAAPVFTDDELTLYFASKNRAGGAGDWDIWVSKRANNGQQYGTPVNVTELNTSATDAPGFITSDGCHIYYSTTKDGNGEIYTASKPK